MFCEKQKGFIYLVTLEKYYTKKNIIYGAKKLLNGLFLLFFFFFENEVKTKILMICKKKQMKNIYI